MEGNPAVAVIKFRWFVLESERTRNGQYRIALKRDVLADHLTQILNAPCFVEKGNIKDINDPLLYNNESMTYNQIKKEEYELKDNSGTAWIVGYMAKNRPNSAVSVSTQVAILDGVPAEYYEEAELPFSVDPDSSTTAYSFTPNKMAIMLPISFYKNGGWGNFYVNQGWKTINYSTNAEDAIKGTSEAVAGSSIGSIDPVTQLNSLGCDKFSSNISGYHSDYDVTFGTVQRFKLTPSLDSTNVNVLGKKYFYS